MIFQGQFQFYHANDERDLWLDDYARIWARYHVYGIGILFGWILSSNRAGNRFTKLVNSRHAVGRILVLLMWILCLLCLVIPVFLTKRCFVFNRSNSDRLKSQIDWNSARNCVKVYKKTSYRLPLSLSRPDLNVEGAAEQIHDFKK